MQPDPEGLRLQAFVKASMRPHRCNPIDLQGVSRACWAGRNPNQWSMTMEWVFRGGVASCTHGLQSYNISLAC